MRDLNVVAEQLFNKIRGRFPSVTIGDGEGNVTNEPALARFYEFDFKSQDSVLGKVSVSLDEKSGVTIMYNKDFTENVGFTERDDWYDFLKGVRVFAKKRLLNFEVRDINKSNFTQRDYGYMAANRGETTMNESALRGTNKTSYQRIGNAKLSIKHTGNIEEGESRTKKIGSLFIENAAGEKFKYPFKHLSGARAMAVHVSEGGHPFDDFGKHITSLSEELSNLRKFKTYMGRSSVMAESLAEHMDTVNERIATVRKTIQNLQKPSNYTKAFENFVPEEKVEVPEDIADSWIDQLTVKQFNEELKDVFPYIYNLVGESARPQELAFEDIVNEVDKASIDAAVGQALGGAPATSPRPKLRPQQRTSDDIFPTEQKAIDDALANGYQEQGKDFEIIPAKGGMFMWRQIGPDVNIGAGGTSELAPNGQPTGSTRGVNTESQIDMAFDKLLGQFADNFSAQVEASHDKDGDGDEDNDDYKIAKDIAIKKAIAKRAEEEPKKESKTPLGEFILSYFDRQTGQFPKGETAVLTSVEKDYGDQYVKPASQFIERLGQVYEKYQARKAGNFNLEEAGEELGNLIKTGVSGAYKYIEKTIRDFEVLLQQNPNHPKAQQYRQELEQLKKMLADAQMQMGESVFKKAKILEAKQEIYRIKQLAEAATAADANSLTQAVKDFQTAAGLQADGVVGPQTKEAHKAAMANSTAAIDNKMGADAAATRDPNSGQAAGDAPAAPAQGQQGAAPAPNAKTAGQGQFERSVQVGGQVYANDADAISALMGKGARTQEEETWLTGKAREYGFYGNQAALPGILDKIRQGAAAQDAADDAAAVDGDPATAQPRAQGYTPKDFPSMAAAMAKVDYYEPGGKIAINGVPHVRDVDGNGRKFFRPIQSGAAQSSGTPTSRLDTKGQI